MADKTDAESFRALMRNYPQGVSVVIADAGEGPRGVTVSSFVSISLTPPLVLIAVSHASQSHPLIDRASCFAINVLSDEQGALSEHFARPDLGSEEQFQAVCVRRGIRGTPWIEGCLAYVECGVVERVAQADHTLFIARVEHSELHLESGRPLVFYSGDYWGLGSVVYGRQQH